VERRGRSYPDRPLVALAVVTLVWLWIQGAKPSVPNIGGVATVILLAGARSERRNVESDGCREPSRSGSRSQPCCSAGAILPMARDRHESGDRALWRNRSRSFSSVW